VSVCFVARSIVSHISFRIRSMHTMTASSAAIYNRRHLFRKVSMPLSSDFVAFFTRNKRVFVNEMKLSRHSVNHAVVFTVGSFNDDCAQASTETSVCINRIDQQWPNCSVITSNYDRRNKQERFFCSFIYWLIVTIQIEKSFQSTCLSIEHVRHDRRKSIEHDGCHTRR
jgi:hypothetical protein